MNLSPNHKILIEIQGGSHSYGLNTANSDYDIRGIYIHTDSSHLVGLKREEVIVSQKTEDSVYTEFRHALKLLRGGNTQMLELLFTEKFITISNEWRQVQAQRQMLIDPNTFYKSLKGYIQGELRLANGERTGKLGGKRKEALDRYGYSPKNFCQLLRLAWAGAIFFEKGYFPVNVFKEDESFGKTLLDIKINPESWSKNTLNRMVFVAENHLNVVFETKKSPYCFNENVVNHLCLAIYRPLINVL